MSNIKTPEFVDIFNDGLHLSSDDSLKESREMMKLRTNQRVWQINQEQRKKDRAYFYDYYKKFMEEAIKPGSPTNKHTYEYLEAIEKMGRRAVPFLYELMINENVVFNDILEKIYNCKFKVYDDSDIYIDDNDDIYEMKMRYEELKNKWIQKIEQEGDV